MIEVTQADREAAADYWRDMVAKVGEVIVERAIREGKMDEMPCVYSFARHRIASQAEAHELLKEVLTRTCANYAYIAPRNIERIKKLVGEA